MKFIRSAEYYKIFTVTLDEIIELGLETATVLANIDKAVERYGSDPHKMFPFIHKDRFLLIIEVLRSKGFIKEVE